MRLHHTALSDMPAIEHGFFTRNGGQSAGSTYHSLNCGYGSDDDRENVTKNRANVATTMGVKASHLLTAYQVHSPDALIVSAPFEGEERPKVDALVTNVPGIAVAVLTADCGPLLFADPKAGVVAAAHAGWKGAFGGVIEASLAKMEELGAERKNITAILGPTISRPNYEVDDGFKDTFLKTDPTFERFFSDGKREGHAQFDLPAFILARLESQNIGAAYNLGRCTYGEDDMFFSYRRSTHRKEPDYGRQISAIAIKP
ncbi:MAG: peptidoglycan editing factor PgeF [Cohaesibacter sp.]|nr:peptidoglycan editing factor PgeF [Cohaesibacter sp.]